MSQRKPSQPPVQADTGPDADALPPAETRPENTSQDEPTPRPEAQTPDTQTPDAEAPAPDADPLTGADPATRDALEGRARRTDPDTDHVHDRDGDTAPQGPMPVAVNLDTLRRLVDSRWLYRTDDGYSATYAAPFVGEAEAELWIANGLAVYSATAGRCGGIRATRAAARLVRQPVPVGQV